MNCEEFETLGLDAERNRALSQGERAALEEHASTCSRCAALDDSWQAAGVELRVFADATARGETPPRVEMRLRQEFRTQHRTVKAHRIAKIAVWALATAALLVGALSWRNGHLSQRGSAVAHLKTPQSAGYPLNHNENAEANRATSLDGGFAALQPNTPASGRIETLVADNEMNDFMLLPGVLQSDVDDAAIVRVRMQRGVLGALGLPVNEDRAGEWIQVDLLVGDDGLPQAVRLPE
jgi:hypothetical protein